MGSLGDPYASLEDVKDYLKFPANKTTFDEVLKDCLDSSSSEIERSCNRQFNRVEQGSSSNEATMRSYYPEGRNLAYVDDFYTTDDLIVEVNGDVWAPYEYELLPRDGIIDGQIGWPYWKIKPLMGRSFPTVKRGWAGGSPLHVTALWGWEAVPAPIHQACLVMAAETFQLKDAPFGVAGMDNWGSQLRVRDNRIAAGKIARFARNRLQVG